MQSAWMGGNKTTKSSSTTCRLGLIRPFVRSAIATTSCQNRHCYWLCRVWMSCVSFRPRSVSTFCIEAIHWNVSTLCLRASHSAPTASVIERAICYKLEGRLFETPMRSIFPNLPNPFSRTRPWGSLSLWRRWVPEVDTMFLGSRKRPVRRDDNLTAICEPTV
jgi:hypothetical protein